MGERFQLPIPMWCAQYQLLGGHRKIVTVSVVYAAALVAGFFGFKQLAPGVAMGPYMSYALNLLTCIQMLVALLAGCNAVHRAMLRDFQTGMIESHRLTPMSNVTVVAGYLFGSTAQLVAVFLITAAFGAVLVVASGFPISDWILGHLLLFSTAVMLWSVAAFLGMNPRKPLTPTPFLVVAALMCVPASFVPAAGMMAGVYAGFLSISMLMGNAMAVAPAALALMTVNFVQAAFWISAAAAKYRRPDLPALNATRGLVLLALALAYGVGGLVLLEALDYRRLMPWSDSPGTTAIEWAVTLTASLLIAVVPVVGAGECRRLIARGAMPRHRSDRIPDLIVILLATALICGVSAGVGLTIWTGLIRPPLAPDLVDRSVGGLSAWMPHGVGVWPLTATVCVTALLAARAVFALTARWLKSGPVAGVVLLLIYWAVPLIGDAIRAELAADYRSGTTHSWLLTLSPPGMLAAIWMDLKVSLWPGLLFQIGLAALLSLLPTVRRGGRGTPTASLAREAGRTSALAYQALRDAGSRGEGS